MHLKDDKKKKIRDNIIQCSKTYSNKLAGKTFLYVFDDNYIEVAFPIDHFLHLTGVATNLSAKNFYKNAKNCILTYDQFSFDTNHSYANAKRKLRYLEKLDDLTRKLVCVLVYTKTKTVLYKLSLSNFEFTLCLIDGIDKDDKMLLFPMSLRAEKNSVERSKDGYFVDFIFSKRYGDEKYNILEFKTISKKIPNSVYDMIDKEIIEGQWLQIEI